MNAEVKCIGKPCAGKSHARFDEGTEETWTMALSGPLTRLCSTLPVARTPFAVFSITGFCPARLLFRPADVVVQIADLPSGKF